MMKVLLVDDERIVRTGLNALVNWKECGMEVAAEAANGHNAFEIMQQQPIDVIITDIRMPIVDGIELTYRVREKYPKTKVILLTCYDDFKYVQEAIEIGASGYVLKTDMEDGALEKTLQKVRKEWEQENVKEEEYLQLQWQAEQSISLRLEKFIKSMIEKNDVCEPQQQMALGLHWLNQPHRMMLIEFESALNFSADKICQLAGKEESLILQWDDCSLLGFVKQPAVNSQSKIMLWEHEYVNRFFANLKTLSGNVNMYYCHSSGCQQISDTFSRLIRVKEYNIFYQGYGHPCDTAGIMIPDCPPDEEIINWKVFKQLAIIRNWGEIKDSCYRAFRHFNQNGLPVEYVKRCTIEMIGIITDVLQSNGSLIEMSWGSNKLEYVSKVQEIKTIRKLEEFLYKGIDVLEESRTIFIGGINKVIEKAIEYIERNYYKEITLDDLSAHAGLSKSYLSSSFKKVTGENFIDYLIHLRIERAKQLFEQTELKTFEVAEKVGIQDPKYFTKLFKRIEGISPKTFKDMGRKKVNPL